MMEISWDREVFEIQNQGQAAAPAEKTYNLFKPGSACPTCQHPIGALENIPIVSYLWLKGQCKGCQGKISPRYLMVELLTGILLGVVAWQFGYTAQAFYAAILTLALITLTFIDFDTMLLPDSITYPILWLGLLVNLNNGFTDIHSAIIGAVAGYLILWSIFWLFKLLTGKEGMGYGDFKLLALIGAWFGWQILPAVIILSAGLGSLIGITLLVLTSRDKSVPMPFGPFLALGGISALFFGQTLSHYYL